MKDKLEMDTKISEVFFFLLFFIFLKFYYLLFIYFRIR